MARRRTTTAEERALFLESFVEVRPVTQKPEPAKIAKPVMPPARKAPQSSSGLDGNTAGRLRRGAMEPDARLDLHGHTVESAHRVLIAFLRASQKAGARLTLIVTGKGARNPDPHAPFDLGLQANPRGALKMLTPRWLAEPALASIVAEVQTAHRRHGGGGALYVYLRKRPR